MQIEIEAKFLNINHDGIRSKLRAIGGKCEKPMTLMKRAMFDSREGDFFNQGGKRLRVRDEGDKITATFKSDGLSKYDHEVEVVVSSFTDTVKLFESIGFKVVSLQESRREVWVMKDVEIMLDEWPWLDPYIEIEGKTEKSIVRITDQLGLTWEDAVFGSVDKAYMHQYTHMKPEDSIGYVQNVVFGRDTPKYLKDRA